MSKGFKSYLSNHFEMKERVKPTFQSYVDLSDGEEKDDEQVEQNATAFFHNDLEPKMLQGEKVVYGADSVLMFAPYTNHKQGISGNLFVTNFKISFVTADKSSYPDSDNTSTHWNKVLDKSDIPLSSVDAVYQVSSGAKKKKLQPGSSVTSTAKYLEVHCMDFQVHVFGFKFTQKDQSKALTNAILQHAFPNEDKSLFAYEFAQSGGHFEEYPESQFERREDWEQELDRLQCNRMWRVSDANVGFKINTSLPEYFVIPNKLMNSEIEKGAGQFKNERLPTWCYTYRNGASLVRMSQSLPDFKKVEDKMLDAIKHASGNEKLPLILDIVSMNHCPSLSDIRSSHERLKQIVMSDSAKEFMSSDSRWLGHLESCQWLRHIASCLNTANHVVTYLTRECQTVVLKEESSCDLTCIISCLVQLQLDPDYRTIVGFQSLIAREWVAMGHPFQTRLRLVSSPDAESEQVPVFLLFLDCVWQLLQQFPSSFAFSETYLTYLWDTLHIGIFGTFLFNSLYQRQKFFNKKGNNGPVLSLPSAWDWKFQLSDDKQLLFNNPLYLMRTTYDLDSIVGGAREALRKSGDTRVDKGYSMTLGMVPHRMDSFSSQYSVLKPEVTASLIKLWSQCYLRWTVPAQIIGGGNPSQYLQQCILVEEVVCLQHKLCKLTQDLKQGDIIEERLQLRSKSELKFPRPQSGLVFGPSGYKSAGIPLSSVYITSSFPFTPRGSQLSQHSFVCGPLSEYLKDTEVDHDYTQDDDD